jgi:FkbM family methyltransferase
MWGGDRGQFSLISRLMKTSVPVLAFEPLPNAANVFRQIHAGNTAIQLHQVALGEVAGEAEIHISQSADSSSLLPIGVKQTDLFPKTKEVGSLKIPVKRLDDFQSDWETYSRILLKIDVQGFELSVLKGAIGALNHCAYVYVECSETELYVGQALFSDVELFLKAHGFRLAGRFNEKVVKGQLIQVDCLFGRGVLQ